MFIATRRKLLKIERGMLSADKSLMLCNGREMIGTYGRLNGPAKVEYLG